MGSRCGPGWIGALAVGLLACRESGAPDPCVEGAAYDAYADACVCEPGTFGDPEIACTPHADLCAEAEDRVGHSVCAHTLDTQDQWNRMSLGGGPASAGTRRYGKYLVPHGPASRLPTVFADANYYRLHYCLMAGGFAPLFPGLTMADQTPLVFERAHREFYGGATYEFEPGGAAAFGFTVETADEPDEQLSLDEVYSVYRTLQDRFAIAELAYVPVGEAQIAAATQWDDPPFVVADTRDEGVTFETYTSGIAYGRVRIVAPDDEVALGWQDIAVFAETPQDHEGVLAAAVTATRQDILSHLNVLAGQRGTPNLFVDDALDLFRPYEGQLVRLQADAIRYQLVPASEAEAAAYWDSSRPHAEVEHPATYEYDGLDPFPAIATDTREQRDQARSIFGAKTVGLATLWGLVEPDRLTPGFGVPFAHYRDFMDGNTWQVDFGDGPETATYAETIARWLDDPSFRTDATLRKQRLDALRAEMAARGVVSPALVAALREQIVAVFGSETVMVRFRSSSNAEDSLTFNGAGLYESRSACAADSDAGAATSACDPGKGPRLLEAALIEVWSSLWSFGAFDERDYYQLDHGQVAMGATVSLRYEDERANGVAFTGNPGNPDDPSYLVNAQYGDTDVVDPTPGQTAELSALTMQSGEVGSIARVVASSLVDPGTPVVTDAQLRELGRIMAELDATYPRDVDEGPEVDRPLLDLEFKVDGDGAIVLKQIRLFPKPEYAVGPTCRD